MLESKLDYLTNEELLELHNFKIRQLENSTKKFVYMVGSGIWNKQDVLDLYYRCRALFIETNGLDKEIAN